MLSTSQGAESDETFSEKEKAEDNKESIPEEESKGAEEHEEEPATFEADPNSHLGQGKDVVEGNKAQTAVE